MYQIQYNTTWTERMPMPLHLLYSQLWKKVKKIFHSGPTNSKRSLFIKPTFNPIILRELGSTKPSIKSAKCKVAK